jgi:hypothetical protein
MKIAKLIFIISMISINSDVLHANPPAGIIRTVAMHIIEVRRYLGYEDQLRTHLEETLQRVERLQAYGYPSPQQYSEYRHCLGLLGGQVLNLERWTRIVHNLAQEPAFDESLGLIVKFNFDVTRDKVLADQAALLARAEVCREKAGL